MGGCLRQHASAARMEDDFVVLILAADVDLLVDDYLPYVQSLHLLISSFDLYFFLYRSIEYVVALILVYHHYHLYLNCVLAFAVLMFQLEH